MAGMLNRGVCVCVPHSVSRSLNVEFKLHYLQGAIPLTSAEEATGL